MEVAVPLCSAMDGGVNICTVGVERNIVPSLIEDLMIFLKDIEHSTRESFFVIPDVDLHGEISP